MRVSPSQRCGAIIPLVALLLPVMLILACFVINVAYMELTRTELRICSDAATRAAGYGLASTGDLATASQFARDAAQRNVVAGRPVRLADADIVYGVSNRASLNSRYVFTPTPGAMKAAAVRVNARRDRSSLSGAVSMIMPTFGATTQFGPNQVAVSSVAELDIALVIDRSGSMAYGVNERSDSLFAQGIMPAMAPPGWTFGMPAPPGSRWLDLVAAMQVLLDALNQSAQDEYVTLVTYGTTAVREQQLSLSYSGVMPGLGKTTQSLKHEATAIGAGITEGLNALNDPTFSRPWAVKAMIVFTDGNHNTGVDPESAAHAAARAGVTIYTITFSEDANKTRMAEVARIGSGQHLHASTGADLKALFKRIAGNLPMLLTQ